MYARTRQGGRVSGAPALPARRPAGVRDCRHQVHEAGLFHGLVGNHDDALDLSQEAFIRAYQALPRFDVQKHFFTWYYKILRNICLNHLRNHSRFSTLSDLSETESTDNAADPAALAERNDLSERLWKAIGTLRDDYREVIILKDIEDCSYQEIAERLEIPPGTVMSRLFNARKHLKEILEKLV